MKCLWNARSISPAEGLCPPPSVLQLCSTDEIWIKSFLQRQKRGLCVSKDLVLRYGEGDSLVSRARKQRRSVNRNCPVVIVFLNCTTHREPGERDLHVGVSQVPENNSGFWLQLGTTFFYETWMCWTYFAVIMSEVATLTKYVTI